MIPTSGTVEVPRTENVPKKVSAENFLVRVGGTGRAPTYHTP